MVNLLTWLRCFGEKKKCKVTVCQRCQGHCDVFRIALNSIVVVVFLEITAQNSNDQQIFTLEKLKPVNICHFCLKKMTKYSKFHHVCRLYVSVCDGLWI